MATTGNWHQLATYTAALPQKTQNAAAKHKIDPVPIALANTTGLIVKRMRSKIERKAKAASASNEEVSKSTRRAVFRGLSTGLTLERLTKLR